MKKMFKILPENLLFIAVIIFWIESSTIFNVFAIVLLSILSITVLVKSLIIKTMVSAIFGLLSLYMMLAVISEFREFDVGDAEGLKMLIIGLSIFIATFVLSLIMAVKNIRFYIK